MSERWQLVPLTLDDANAYVRQHHRHSGPVVGAKFVLGAGYPPEQEYDDWRLVGIAIVGRPVARHYDDGWTLEVNRLCSTGEPNIGSFLYAAAWRAARALGFTRLVTYTLASESGSSLKAAGWVVVGERPARRGWDAPSRPRSGTYRSEQRVLWEVVA